VVDDGSDDDFESAIAPYAERVTCVRGPHRGLAQASNIAITNSRGDAIACVDADDLLLPGSLATRARLLEEMPMVGLVFGPALLIDEAGRTVGLRRPALQAGLLPSAQAFRWLLRGCRVPSPTVMLRRQTFEEVGPFRDEAFPGEDWHMWLRVAARYDLYCLGRPVACYRLHPSSITARYWLEAVERSHRFTLADVFAWAPPDYRRLEPLAHRYLERTLAALAARLGRRREFVSYLGAALARHPALLLEAETWGCAAVGLRSLLPGPLLGGLKRMKAPFDRQRLRRVLAGHRGASAGE